MKRVPLIAILASIILVIGFVTFSNLSSGNTTPATPTDTYQYFWGNTCPHCVNVANFLESWEGKEKVKIDKREVYDNQDNAKLLLGKAASCNIPQDQVPVPFLVTPEGKCIVGDTPIIDHFKNLSL